MRALASGAGTALETKFSVKSSNQLNLAACPAQPLSLVPTTTYRADYIKFASAFCLACRCHADCAARRAGSIYASTSSADGRTVRCDRKRSLPGGAIRSGGASGTFSFPGGDSGEFAGGSGRYVECAASFTYCAFPKHSGTERLRTGCG